MPGLYTLCVSGRRPEHDLAFGEAMRRLQLAFEAGFDSARVTRER
jgi:hypothetical protein